MARYFSMCFNPAVYVCPFCRRRLNPFNIDNHSSPRMIQNSVIPYAFTTVTFIRNESIPEKAGSWEVSANLPVSPPGCMGCENLLNRLRREILRLSRSVLQRDFLLISCLDRHSSRLVDCYVDEVYMLCPNGTLESVSDPRWLGSPWNPEMEESFPRHQLTAKHWFGLKQLIHLQDNKETEAYNRTLYID